MLFLPLFAAALMQDAIVPAVDPLAPARAGQLQCYSPDTARKTCNSLAGYGDNGDGTYTNTATVLLSSQPAITMSNATSVRLIDGAVCGTLSQADIAAGTVSVDGQVLPSGQAQFVLAAVSNALDKVIDHEICTTYEPAGEGLVAHGSLDGVARPDMDQPIIWVTPSDGYTVAP